MFAARWFMAPLYFGMLAALLLLAVKFVQKLVFTLPKLFAMSSNEAILAVLTLVDLTLVGNLVLMVMFAGWENFVGRMGSEGDARPDWMAGLDFSALKLKLIASIAAIASIHMLETSLDIRGAPTSEVAAELAVLLGFALTGVLLALMDRLAGGGH